MNRNGLYNPCLRGWTVPSAVWDYLMSGFMEDQHVPIEQKLVYAILWILEENLKLNLNRPSITFDISTRSVDVPPPTLHMNFD